MKNYIKSTGIAICSFYGVIALAGIYQILANKLGLYNSSISRIIWIFQDVICCIAMLYIGINKFIKPSMLGRIGASILSLMFALFAVNLVLSFADIDILTSINQYFGITISIVELCAAALLFYSIKAWMPMRISAFVYWIPCLCSSFYLSKIKMATELAHNTSDWALLDKIVNAA